MREAVYARNVASGKMPLAQAEHELRTMGAVLDTLRRQRRIWGPGDVMVVAAFRYCLGQRTYIVSDCVDWLIDMWPHLSGAVRHLIMRELNEEFARDDEARERGSEYLPLGMNCDREQWERIRASWRQ